MSIIAKLVTVRSQCDLCKHPTQMAHCTTCDDVFMEGCEPGCNAEDRSHVDHEIVREGDLANTTKGICSWT